MWFVNENNLLISLLLRFIVMNAVHLTYNKVLIPKILLEIKEITITSEKKTNDHIVPINLRSICFTANNIKMVSKCGKWRRWWTQSCVYNQSFIVTVLKKSYFFFKCTLKKRSKLKNNTALNVFIFFYKNSVHGNCLWKTWKIS